MTDDSTIEAGIGAPAGSSRRSVLGSIAATGALASVPTGVFGLHDGAGEELEVVADFEPPALPENLAIDDEGTVYLSMGPSGELRAIDPEGNESSVATIDTGEEGLLLGVTVLDGVLYVANGSNESETHGVWRVEDGGEPERIAALPADETMPNGIIPDPFVPDALLVTDHLGGAIWRVTTDGEADTWISDPLLEPDLEAETPVGADGLVAHPDGDIYVDNLNAGSIIRVSVDDGSADELEEVVRDDSLVGADGMTVDEEGALYVAVNAENEVVRVTPDYDLETLVADENLDFPADVHFGTTEAEATSLYISNFAYGTFLADEGAAEPSLAKLDVGVRGYFPESPTSDTTAENEADSNTAETDGDE